MLRRIYSLVVKEFIHLRRDWWLPTFMLIGGVLELLLIGWATSRPITNLPLMVYDLDNSRESRELIQSFINTTTFTLYGYAENLDQIEAVMESGKINAGLIIPLNFRLDLEKPGVTPEISLILNGSETTAATSALRSAEGLIQSVNLSMSMRKYGVTEIQHTSFLPSLRLWFNEALNEALYTTPAELGLMLEFTVLIFAALTFTREKELGTLEQLLVLPYSSLEIIIGKSLPVILIGIIDFSLMLGVIHQFFDVPIRGSLTLLIIIAFIYIFVELGKGLVISVISKTQQQAFLLVMLIGMVDFMFTGYAAPVEAMPEILQKIGFFVPAYHWLTILRSILLKGAGIEVLWENILMLLILGLVIGGFSIYYVRKSLD